MMRSFITYNCGYLEYELEDLPEPSGDSLRDEMRKNIWKYPVKLPESNEEGIDGGDSWN